MNQAVKTPVIPNTKPVKKKKRRAKSLDKAKARAGWFFVAPFVLVFFLVYIPIIIDSITFSFHTIYPLSGGTGFVLDPVGWQNYNDALFVDPLFMTTLTGGIQQLVLEVPAIVIFSLFMAVLLNQKMVGRTFFRAVFFIPVILSTGLLDDIDMNNAFTQYASGGMEGGAAAGQDASAAGGAVAEGSTSNQIITAVDLQGLFSSMKVGTELVDYVVNIVNDVYNLVNRSGVQMLIFLAGLQSISPAIYESCTIDGATTWETFWKITFPMISPMILVNGIYTIIDSFTSSSNQVMSYIGTVYSGSAQGANVLATAMYWIYFALVILIVAAVAMVMSTYVFYQRRD